MPREEFPPSENKDFSTVICLKDLDEARKFLKEIYESELKKPNSHATVFLTELYLDHSERVAEIAREIAIVDGFNIAKLEMAGILHDCGKINALMPTGLDELVHGTRGQKKTYDFLVERLGKNPRLAQEIAYMVARHIYTPESLKNHPNFKAAFETPESEEEWALRDANMLDYIDFWGIKHIVEVIHEVKAPLSMYDGSDKKNSLKIAFKRRAEFISAIHGKTAKKIAVALKKRSDRFMEFIKNKKIENIGTFRLLFDEFVKGELKH